MEAKRNNFIFFLGTEAELIKMASVIRTFRARGAAFRIISSGQNDIRKSPILEYLKIPRLDRVLYDKPIRQTPFGLCAWFLVVLFKSIFVLHSEKKSNRSKTWLIIHGDTVTTMVGAIAGKITGFKIIHVEAGYKSGNFLHPFPEELDRTVASALSDILFCPYDSIGFVPETKKNTVNIGYNTSIDSLNISLKLPNRLRLNKILSGKKYFIFALHRQETLLNKQLVKRIINQLLRLNSNLFCVFAMHNPTKKFLKDMNLYNKLVNNDRIICPDRLPYFEYVHLLKGAEFIMTDGVGNQQEAYYLGKPCLVLRSKTEGKEGLGYNAVLSNNDSGIIKSFVKNYHQYIKDPLKIKKSPSKIICDYLLKNI